MPDAGKTTPNPDFAALRKLLEAATPRPWIVDETRALGAYGVWNNDTGAPGMIRVCSVVDPSGIFLHDDREQRDANAGLIAAAVNALPSLLARVEELEAIMRDVPGLHRRKCYGCGQTHWHAQDRTPGVLCPECGSQDTRRVKP